MKRHKHQRLMINNNKLISLVLSTQNTRTTKNNHIVKCNQTTKSE